MAMTMQLDIVSAETSLFSGKVEFIAARATGGEIGILPRHTPLLAQLQPGEIRVKVEGGEEQFFYVSGGILEVQPDGVTVLADTAVRAKDLDEAAAQAAKQRAEEALRDEHISDEQYAALQAMLQKSLAQLKVKRRRAV